MGTWMFHVVCTAFGGLRRGPLCSSGDASSSSLSAPASALVVAPCSEPEQALPPSLLKGTCPPSASGQLTSGGHLERGSDCLLWTASGSGAIRRLLAEGLEFPLIAVFAV